MLCVALTAVAARLVLYVLLFSALLLCLIIVSLLCTGSYIDFKSPGN